MYINSSILLSVLQRVQLFLPRISHANSVVAQNGDAATALCMEISDVQDESSLSSSGGKPYIEMVMCNIHILYLFIYLHVLITMLEPGAWNSRAL